MKYSTLAIAAALAFGAQLSFAQTNTPKVDERQAKQEQRIDQGVSSGTLTNREATRLERQQTAIDKVENNAKADGTVTKAERAKLAKMQQHANRSIKHQKHDRQDKPSGS